MSFTLLTWKAFCVALAEGVLFGGAEAPVGFAVLVSGLAADELPLLLPEVLDAVPGWPLIDTSWPT
jgi:hypothetical protein